MVMKKGLIVPKGFGLVYVYTTNKGGREACFNAPREKLHSDYDHDLRYTLFGVFLYNSETLNERDQARFRNRWNNTFPHGDEAGDIGTSEGFSLQYESNYKNGEYVRSGRLILKQDNRYNRHFIQRRRENFQDKLKAINKKAKELIELGVDRAAAIKAAKKCACVH